MPAVPHQASRIYYIKLIILLTLIILPIRIPQVKEIIAEKPDFPLPKSLSPVYLLPN
jgi:hypothetical protein